MFLSGNSNQVNLDSPLTSGKLVKSTGSNTIQSLNINIDSSDNVTFLNTSNLLINNFCWNKWWYSNIDAKGSGIINLNTVVRGGIKINQIESSSFEFPSLQFTAPSTDKVLINGVFSTSGEYRPSSQFKFKCMVSFLDKYTTSTWYKCSYYHWWKIPFQSKLSKYQVLLVPWLFFYEEVFLLDMDFWI